MISTLTGIIPHTLQTSLASPVEFQVQFITLDGDEPDTGTDTFPDKSDPTGSVLPNSDETDAAESCADLQAELDALQAVFDTYKHNATAKVNHLRRELKTARAQLVALPDKQQDALTMRYLRAYLSTLSPANRKQLPDLLLELGKPWNKRGTVWTRLVRHVQAAAERHPKLRRELDVTPYEASPPISTAKGQGAIRPKPAA